MLYNKENKFKFLDSIEDELQKRAYIDVFDIASECEYKLKKDLIYFNVAELQMLFTYFYNKKTKKFTKSNINAKRQLLLVYINYNIPMNIQKNQLKELPLNVIIESLNQIGEVESSFLITKSKFEDYKRNIMTHKKANTYLALLLCPFYSIKGGAKDYAEIYNIRMSDLDKANGTIKLFNGRIVENVPMELFMALEMAYNTNYTLNGVPLDLFNYPDQIFKANVKSNSDSTYEKSINSMITDFFSRQLKKIIKEDRINVRTIYNSGLINFVYESALKDGFNLKEDLKNENQNNNLSYKKYILNFGSNMPLNEFKWKFKDFIINNY